VTGHDLLLFATGLFAIQSPPTTVGAFLSYTKGLPLPTQRRVALRAALAMALAMVIVVFVGERLLSLLGVTVPMLQSAGGLILLVTGMQMVSGHGLPGPAADADPEQHWKTMAVVPIAIPLNVGGGAIAFIVAVSSTNANTPDQVALSAICVGMAILTGVVYVFAVPVARWLGITGMATAWKAFAACSRIGAFAASTAFWSASSAFSPPASAASSPAWRSSRWRPEFLMSPRTAPTL